jgi:hypothetical protein
MTWSAPGTVKVCTFELRDADGSLYDPPSVTIRAGLIDNEPGLSLYEGEAIEHPSTGIFRVEHPCPDAGEYGARLEAFNAESELRGAVEVYWTIRASRLIS